MTGFPGFPPTTLPFLRDLRDNNSRDWFIANNADYQAGYKIPARHFSETMATELETMTGLPHTTKIFRINRDLRFTEDRRPYNTHLHILFTPCDLPGAPAWFFGLDPERLSLGAGNMGFDKTALDHFRQRVVSDPVIGSTLVSMRNDGIRISEPELKRVPGGFPADHSRADLLRHKSLHGWVDHPDPAQVIGDNVIDICMFGFSRLRPLFDLLLDDPR